MKTVWTEQVNMPSFPALEGERKTDVLIIGGGMAGLLCALRLQREGVDCLLVEAKTLGSGITSGTTAVISAQHDVLYQDLISHAGEKYAEQYLRANLWAVEEYRKLSKTIDCDFEDRPSVLYSMKDRTLMEKETDAVNSLGFPAEFTNTISLPLVAAGGVRFPGQAQFHPLKFMAGAAKDLNICENTFVRRLEGHTAYTDKGKINAGRIIVTTHFPFLNSHGMYFAKMYQVRFYVIAVKTASSLPETYSEYGGRGMFFRSYGNLLLIGGCDHRTGKKSNYEPLRHFATRYYPQATERFAWGNQDCVGLDGVPYIGPYSGALPHVFAATGFNGWGMTTSMAAAGILTDLVLEREPEYAGVFAPNRSMMKKQLFVNMGESLGNLVLPTTKRCPHLGCALRWNETEHTWDCPCHGSRFDELGHLIDNPAMKDAKVR